MPRWDDVRDEFAWEGSWRDICVVETTISHWCAAWHLLRRLDVTYAVDGVQTAPPDDVTQILAWPRDPAPMLTLLVGGAQLNCHFFDASEIEFDLDPRQVTGQRNLDAIVSFMADLANATGRAALMTPENMHEFPFLRVAPSATTAEYIPTGGFFREAARQHETQQQALARGKRSS